MGTMEEKWLAAVQAVQQYPECDYDSDGNCQYSAHKGGEWTEMDQWPGMCTWYSARERETVKALRGLLSLFHATVNVGN